MSQEIRTLLAGILGATDLLAGTTLSTQQSASMKTIRDSSLSLLTIVNDMVDISTIEAGALVLEKIDFNIMTVVEDTIALLKPSADVKGLDLIIENMLAGSSTYQGDPQRLKQILTNLIGNAIQFTAAGSVTLGIEKSQEYADSSVVLFSVTDTGIGMSEEEKGRLVLSFTKGGESPLRIFDGRGLGLTITKHLAELMGGAIGAESVSGVGSTFWCTAAFTKRLRRGASAATTLQTSAQSTLRDPNVRYDARLLLVEDFPTNQKVARAILEKLGFSAVDVVENGHEAVQAAGTGCYDLIIMDVQMPELDGLTATKIIRGTGSTVPIVGLTAYAILGDREKCLAAGMDEYLTKPINRQDLRTVLEKHLSLKKPKQPSSPESGGSIDTPTSSKIDIYNHEELLAILLGDEENLRMILSEFVSELPNMFGMLEAYIAAGDRKNASRLAHGIKGGSASVCCRALSTYAGDLETACEQNDFMTARACMKELQTQFETLLSFVGEAGAETQPNFSIRDQP